MSENLLVNTIIWISSLPEEEMGPTRRITEDIEVLSVVVENHQELLQTLEELAIKAENIDLKPILGSPRLLQRLAKTF